jgi:hypothetical protein
MRPLLVSCFALALLGSPASVHVNKRIFIIANNSAVCSTAGQKCSAAKAAAYCKSREFKRALSYRKVARHEITGGVPVGEFACGEGKCNEFVAIECAR